MSTKLPLLYSVFGLAVTGGEGDPLCWPLALQVGLLVLVQYKFVGIQSHGIYIFTALAGIEVLLSA